MVENCPKIVLKGVSNKLVAEIVDSLEEKKGNRISVLNLMESSDSITDFFVICDAESGTKMSALAENVRYKLSKNLEEKPLGVEGNEDSGWMLLDYVDVIVHIFSQEKRKIYNLEGLWSDVGVLEYC